MVMMSSRLIVWLGGLFLFLGTAQSAPFNQALTTFQVVSLSWKSPRNQ